MLPITGGSIFPSRPRACTAGIAVTTRLLIALLQGCAGPRWDRAWEAKPQRSRRRTACGVESTGVERSRWARLTRSKWSPWRWDQEHRVEGGELVGLDRRIGEARTGQSPPEVGALATVQEVQRCQLRRVNAPREITQVAVPMKWSGLVGP